MTGIIAIVKKELRRVFQDKKLVFSLFIMPVVLMVGIFTLVGNLQGSMMKDIYEHETIMYIQNAPAEFEQFLSATNFKGNIAYYKDDSETARIKKDILEGNVDALVVFEEDFQEKINAYVSGGVIPEVKTYYNPSEQYSQAGRSKFVDNVLMPYQQKLLTDRIGSLENIQVFYIDKNQDDSVIVDEKKAGGQIMGMMLPYFITMLLFAGAMNLGIDSITGEKERGTLSSMLITPIKRSNIVLGKLISLSILSCLSAAVYAGAMIGALPMAMGSMGDEELPINITFTIVQIVQLLIIMLTLVFLYVAIISIVAIHAKTAKEAGTYITPMYIVVIVVGLGTMFQTGEMGTNLYMVPILGSTLSIQSLLKGELTNIQFLMTISGTMVAAFILTFFITKAFKSEKVMFNA